MGQGACMAIESSLVLARCLEQEDDLAVALTRYEKERMPRTAWITRQSRKIGRLDRSRIGGLCGSRLVRKRDARCVFEKAIPQGREL